MMLKPGETQYNTFVRKRSDFKIFFVEPRRFGKAAPEFGRNGALHLQPMVRQPRSSTTIRISRRRFTGFARRSKPAASPLNSNRFSPPASARSGATRIASHR
jgi:hypothetical protein